MIQIEPVWLSALPAVFGFGWLAARWERRLEVAEDEAEQSKKQKKTFKGLNLLLNEQPDKAIDALVEVAQLDPETTELHFALGSLFRRRGETERAIRVHQHLANRQDIPKKDRDHAAYELGRDFLRAGMLDRAESTLNRVGDSQYSTPAKVALFEMYQIEKDWRKAIVAATELQSLGSQDFHREIAHFHCELAQEAIRRKDLSAAQMAVEQALQVVPFHARATIIQGELAALNQRPKEALEIWSRLEAKHPMYLLLVADRWMAAHAELGLEVEGLERLKQHLKQQASGELLDIVFKHVLRIEGPQAAEALMAEVMHHTPSLTAMTKRLEAQLKMALLQEDQKLEIDINASLNLLKQKTGTLARYTCGSCGFRARRFYWQCPGCNHWDAYSPKRSEGSAPSSPSM